MSIEQNDPRTLADASAQVDKIAEAVNTWERDTRLAHAMGYAAALLSHRLIDMDTYTDLLAGYRAARDAWRHPITGAAKDGPADCA
ncbi:hypothetical protein KZ843_06800 [Pseudomonas aeruginosa]|nr:hypothetical protein [Pseudomonas aeruginosa]MBW6122601.1 hypothetical protein [Pseudomonas aeruginosa]